MKVVKGYKQTELGEIPEDWHYKTFVEAMKGFSSGQTPSRSVKKYYTGKIPWITSGELNYNVITDTIEKITAEAAINTHLKTLPVGTFLMAITGLEAEGTRGSCGLTGVEATTNQSCMALYPNDGELTTEYLFQFYVKYGNWLAFKYCQGTKQQSYTGKIAKTLPIIFPPTVEEQNAITTALNETDNYISTLEKLIHKKQNIKQGTMQVLLTGKKRLKSLKGEWEMKKLGEVAEINMGQSPDSKNYNANGDGLPLIQGNADIENRKSIKRVWTSQTTKTCNKGDLILTVRAPVGSVGYASEYSCIGRGVCSMKSKIVDNSFLYHILIFKEADWKIIEQGSTFTSANSNQIFAFPIYLPKSKNEQVAISEILNDIDAEIEQLQSQLSKYKAVKEGMMQNLLTGKVRLL